MQFRQSFIISRFHKEYEVTVSAGVFDWA